MQHIPAAIAVPLLMLSACTPARPPVPDAPTTSSSAAAVSIPGVPTVSAQPVPRSWVDLRVGDCLVDLPPSDPSVVLVATVECAAPHRAEVFLRAPVAVNEAIAGVADHRCASGLTAYTGLPAEQTQFAITYLIDSNQDRTSNNPEPSTVICILHAADGRADSGSVRR